MREGDTLYRIEGWKRNEVSVAVDMLMGLWRQVVARGIDCIK